MAMDDPQLGPVSDGRASDDSDVVVTALALLALTNDGQHPYSAIFGETIQSGAIWLLHRQDPDSGSFTPDSAPRNLLHHAIATLAIAEICGYGSCDALRPFAEKAAAYLHAQQASSGSWRDQDRGEDLSGETTGWAVLAIDAAKSFKIYDALGQFYIPAAGFEPASRRGHATRLLARFFLGHKRDATSSEDASICLELKPVWEPVNDLEYWFFATRGLYQSGGRHWRNWSRPFLTAVVDEQRHDGNFKGSWNPDALWGRQGGRVYATAMLTLSLETYYAYTALVR